ncbi:MAG: AmmeMemoRadiSam system radical SAM enzyme [Nitrospirae bacterium]|nr:AmmeMemoRadiSam system radical SAM enzyme [Nitrospirota bacterium]
MKEALLYDKLHDSNVVLCRMCAHRCRIPDGSRGKCAVRENRGGMLYSLVYGRLCASNIDPIEKKPLFHFLPGSHSLSIACVGCNFTCLHCQNSSISQFPKGHEFDGLTGDAVSPAHVVEGAIRGGCKSISYTYTEPTIYMEYALDCAIMAKEKGIKNVFVSNGYMTAESAGLIIPYLDADNIDLKGDDEFYKTVCGGRVKPVKDTIILMKERGVWVEVTTLIIPGLNDSGETLKSIAGFIKSVDESIPWHVTSFHPMYKILDRPATPADTLKRAYRIGIDAGLKYVYEGNVPGSSGENTYCPSCKELLIERYGFSISRNLLKEGKCPKCEGTIDGIWQ